MVFFANIIIQQNDHTRSTYSNVTYSSNLHILNYFTYFCKKKFFHEKYEYKIFKLKSSIKSPMRKKNIKIKNHSWKKKVEKFRQKRKHPLIKRLWENTPDKLARYALFEFINFSNHSFHKITKKFYAIII